MKQIFSFLVLLIIRSTLNTALSQSDDSKALIRQSSSEIKLQNFSVVERNDKTYLEWDIANNGAVDRFEVERSVDGRKFTTAALVFGSEELNSETYKFFEPRPKGNVMYRLKMFSKDLKIAYSNVVFLKM